MSEQNTTPEDFLSGGGAPAAKWPTVGSKIGGTVLEFEMQDQTDYDSGEVLYWDKTTNSKVVASKAPADAEPLVQLVMTIQSEATGFTYEGLQNVRKDLPDDDGQRRLFIRAALRGAVIKAIKAAKGKLEIGAYVEVERLKDGAQPNPKFAAPHQFKATWTPAGKNAHAVAEFLTKDDPSAPSDADVPPAEDEAPGDPWAS